ncbi:MAG: NAD-dependent deacylase [Gemmatimonadetes bacterium]|nr:NAD-dependent deacylase [Gemmatimonadota bacterium]MBI2403823.1 NAD-dependent deacylase [Gemmatimonadota bacterium]MBI2614793.1 NAD-dependent deacylase [Gemmatimonadota bacterium]MBI3082340.1 NAD-dependent deacylase [Gemmatimonadota bacterium]
MSPDAVRAAELLHDARHLVVFTGSGMSQESGVPTFRDEETGLWARFDPEELATPEAFRRHPGRVFAWYLWRWRAIRDALPHAGYRALVELEDRFDRLTIVTQNVDGLHARAGSAAVIELHGSLVAFRCLDAGHPYDARRLEELRHAGAEEIEPPRCDRCGSPVRPGVVWFGEPLPWEQLEAARAEVDACDALLVVGTTALVYPAADLAWVGVTRGIPVIEINPQPTPLSSHVALAWRAGAGVALPELASALQASLPAT